jgi:hypothetical protein
MQRSGGFAEAEKRFGSAKPNSRKSNKKAEKRRKSEEEAKRIESREGSKDSKAKIAKQRMQTKEESPLLLFCGYLLFCCTATKWFASASSFAHFGGADAFALASAPPMPKPKQRSGEANA